MWLGPGWLQQLRSGTKSSGEWDQWHFCIQRCPCSSNRGPIRRPRPLRHVCEEHGHCTGYWERRLCVSITVSRSQYQLYWITDFVPYFRAWSLITQNDLFCLGFFGLGYGAGCPSEFSQM